MANFGFRNLALVEPYAAAWEEARSAVGAEEILKSARITRELREAIGDAVLVVGTTTGSRRNLNRDLISLAELPAWLRRRRSAGLAALLFGSEKTGLSNEHLSYCHALVRVPTTPACPSMNLGQAVAVCCYELARQGAAGAGRIPIGRVHRSLPANLQSLEHLLERAARVLDRAGYFTPRARRAQLLKLRRFLLDLRLTQNDVRILGGVLAQVEWKLDHPDRLSKV